MGAAQGLAPLLQLLPPWEMGKVRWGGRGWSCAAAPGNSLPGSGTAPMPGWKEGWKEFCPVCSANPFRSPLSCSTPLCPQHRAPGASSIPSSPRKVPGVTFRAEKKPCGSWHAPDPREKGTESLPGAEPSHPHLGSPFDTDNLGSAAREPLGSGCNQRCEAGMRGAEGDPAPPGNSWQPLEKAKTLRCLPGSRSCRHNPAPHPPHFPGRFPWVFPLLAVG